MLAQVTLDGLGYEKELQKIKKMHVDREKLNEEIHNFKVEVKRLVEANVIIFILKAVMMMVVVMMMMMFLLSEIEKDCRFHQEAE